MELARIEPAPLSSPLRRERECLAHCGHKGLGKNLLNDCRVPGTVRGATETGKVPLLSRGQLVNKPINRKLFWFIISVTKNGNKNGQWNEE